MRNLPDGRSVEAEASGERAALDAFAAALREGPPGSHVGEFTETVVEEGGGGGEGFVVR